MAKEVKLNYTPEMVAELSLYKNAEDKPLFAKQFAEKYNKPLRSVSAKLAQLGIYEKPVEKPKEYKNTKTKAEVLADLSKMVGEVDFDFVKAGSGASLGFLNTIVAKLSAE